MPWGFNRRSTAEAAAELTRQKPPRAINQVAKQFQMRSWIVQAPSGGIPGRQGAAMGQATCCIFYIDPDGDLENQINHAGDGMDQELDVYNIDPQPIEAQELAIAWQIGGRPTVGFFPTEAGKPKWLRFTTDSKMNDRVCTGIVDTTETDVINPETGQPFVRGDGLLLFDPNNLFAEVEIGATGTAYYRTSPPGVTNPTPPPEDDLKRWEIETCSKPINLIRAKLIDCLKYSDITGAAVFGDASSPTVPDWILSSYPNVDFPGEVNVASTEDYSIDFLNPFHLDAVKDSIVTLRRQTDLDESDPTNLEVPKAGSATDALWEIVEVFEQIARWVIFTQTGGTPVLKSFWEGDDPRPCGSDTVSHRLSSCLRSGDDFIACYDPEADLYVPVSSLLIGEHNPVTSMNFNGCTLVYTGHCDGEDPPGGTTIPSSTMTVVDGFYSDGGELCVTFTDICVIDCCPESGSVGSMCVDICPLLCECPELLSVPEVCPKPPLCNCENCTFEDGPVSVSLSAFVPINGGGEEQRSVSTNSFLPNESDPCCWTAVFPGDQFMEVCYGGDAWSVTGDWPETDVTEDMSFTGPGDCSGSNDLEDGGHTPSSGSVTADGVECQEGLCCEGFTGDARAGLEALWGQFQIRSIGWPGVDPGTAPGTDGACGISFNLPVTIKDDPFGPQCDAIAECVLGHDPINGCIWSITIPPCDDVPGFPGGTFTVEGCNGGECVTTGTCDLQGAGQPFDAGEFIVEPPALGPCVAPPVTLGAMALPAAERSFLPISTLQDSEGFDLVRIPAQIKRVRPKAEGQPPRIESKIKQSLPGLGTEFAAENEELFVGCGCKRIALSVMNKWDIYNVTADQITDLSIALNSKNKKVTVEHYTELISKFVDARQIEQKELDAEGDE